MKKKISGINLIILVIGLGCIVIGTIFAVLFLIFDYLFMNNWNEGLYNTLMGFTGPLFLGFIGLGITIISIPLYLNTKRVRKRCNVKIPCKIVSYHEYYKGKVIFPILQDINGRTFELTQSVEPKKYPIGTTFDVYFNPYDINEFYIKKFERPILFIGCFIVGVLFLLGSFISSGLLTINIV